MTPKPGRLRDPSDNPTNAPLRMSWGRRNTRQADRQVKSLNSTDFGRLHLPFLHRLRVPRISETLPDVRPLRAVRRTTAVRVCASATRSPVLPNSRGSRTPQRHYIRKSQPGRWPPSRVDRRYDRHGRKSLTSWCRRFTTNNRASTFRRLNHAAKLRSHSE